MQEKLQCQLSIAVCDDESADGREIECLTKEILQEEQIGCEISVYEDEAMLLDAIKNGRQFHILLLDVMMDRLDGMHLAAALRRRENDASIIFISANREMVMQGYVVAASRYLSKPVDRELLREALLFCSKKALAQKEILLQTKNGQSRILLSDILYIETWNRGVRLVLLDGATESGVRIAQMAQTLLSPPFVFCHRTILVNLSHVRHIRYCELELDSGDLLPVSKYGLAQVRKEMLDYLKKVKER